MEILSGGGAVSNANVGLLHDFSVSLLTGNVGGVTQLQESLESGGGVLGTISIVTMGKEHDETVLDIPLRFSRDNLGVNHDLSTVGEVTELGFPEAESVRVGLGVSVFESKDSVFRQVRASSDEVSDTTSVGNDRVNWYVRAVLVLVVDRSMSVGEGSSLNILSRKTDVVAFIDEGGESEGFSLSPTDSLTSLDSGHSFLINLGD